MQVTTHTDLVECEWGGKAFLGKLNSYGIAVIVCPRPEAETIPETELQKSKGRPTT